MVLMIKFQCADYTLRVVFVDHFGAFGIHLCQHLMKICSTFFLDNRLQIGPLRLPGLLHRLKQVPDIPAVALPVLIGAVRRLFSSESQAVHNPQEQFIFIPGNKKTPEPAGKLPEFFRLFRIHIG